MLLTDAKEGNFCFLNDLLHLEQTQKEHSLSQIKLLRLPVVYWEEERVISINEGFTIAVTQTGTIIAGINWASANRLSELTNSSSPL